MNQSVMRSSEFAVIFIEKEKDMDALKFVRRVDNDTLVLPMLASYRDQEVEVIVLKKEGEPKPILTTAEKLAVIKQFAGIFANSEWQPGPDFEDEMYTQE